MKTSDINREIDRMTQNRKPHFSNTNNPIDFPVFTVVICSECSEEHLTTEVQSVNIEEDIQGRDILYFVCPVTNMETKSLVYKK